VVWAFEDVEAGGVLNPNPAASRPARSAGALTGGSASTSATLRLKLEALALELALDDVYYDAWGVIVP
jgi:hypothetical protein